MNRTIPYRAVLIDFDGTMADTIEPLFQVYLDFLFDMGIEGSREEFDYLNGRSIQESVAYLKETHRLDRLSDELYAGYMERVRRMYENDVQLFEDTEAFLDALGRRGLRVIIVSSAPREYVGMVLSRYHLLESIDGIVTAEDVRRSKPDPAIYLSAQSQLGLPADEILVIEDSFNGIRSALGAGLPTVAISHSGPLAGLPPDIVASCGRWQDILERVLR